jgi:hypothetical protein
MKIRDTRFSVEFYNSTVYNCYISSVAKCSFKMKKRYIIYDSRTQRTVDKSEVQNRPEKKHISMQVVCQQFAGMKPCTAPSPTYSTKMNYSFVCLNQVLVVLNSPVPGFRGKKTLLFCTSPWYHRDNFVFRKATQLASSVKKTCCNWLKLQNV